MNVSDSELELCLSSLKRAKTDTERLASLFIVVRTLRSIDEAKSEGEIELAVATPESVMLDVERPVERQRLEIFNAVGFDFVNRLLRTKDVPEADAFRGIALAVLASFATIQELAGHPQMVDNVSELMMAMVDKDLSREARMDALKCIAALMATTNGTSVLTQYGETLIQRACEVLMTSMEEQDEPRARLALSVVVRVANDCGEECWGGEERFGAVAEVVTTRMCESKSVDVKLDMCDAMADLVDSCPTGDTGNCGQWVIDCRKQIYEALRSRLLTARPTSWFKLAAALVRRIGLERVFGGEVNCLELLVHLTCVELRMSLDGHSVDYVVRRGTDLPGACFCILEAAVELLVGDEDSDVNAEARRKMYTVVTEAMGSVVTFLRVAVDESSRSLPEQERNLLHGIVRLLGAWLAEETEAFREEVYEILPAVVAVCLEDASCLRFLLPGLCHLSVEDPARRILLERRVPEALVAFLERSWDTTQDTSDDAAMTTAADVLLNVTVLEGPAVATLHRATFLRLLRFLFRAVPELDKARTGRLVLMGHLAVLGLLTLRHLAPYLKASDTAIYRFLSATVRFLWDAFGVDDARCLLVVASAYRPHWEDLREMWFLGLQAIGALLPAVPWVASFIVESGWGQDVVRTLDKVKAANVEPSVRVAFQDLLCRLLASEEVATTAASALRDQGAMRVCETHDLKELRQALVVANPDISQ